MHIIEIRSGVECARVDRSLDQGVSLWPLRVHHYLFDTLVESTGGAQPSCELVHGRYELVCWELRDEIRGEGANLLTVSVIQEERYKPAG